VLTNQGLHNAISTEFTRFKREHTNRQRRIDVTERLTEQYFAEHGAMPSASVLERMATLILQDELADATPWKSQNNEYHIQSEREELDYYKGLVAKQVPDTIATTGVDMRTPTRRKRTPAENAHIDREMGGKRKNIYAHRTKTDIMAEMYVL